MHLKSTREINSRKRISKMSSEGIDEERLRKTETLDREYLSKFNSEAKPFQEFIGRTHLLPYTSGHDSKTWEHYQNFQRYGKKCVANNFSTSLDRYHQISSNRRVRSEPKAFNFAHSNTFRIRKKVIRTRFSNTSTVLGSPHLRFYSIIKNTKIKFIK